MMFVLLQIYPPEASDNDDWCCCLDVITVSLSKVAREPRYRAACAAFDTWDADISRD